MIKAMVISSEIKTKSKSYLWERMDHSSSHAAESLPLSVLPPETLLLLPLTLRLLLFFKEQFQT